MVGVLLLLLFSFVSDAGGFRGGVVYDLNSIGKAPLFTIHAELMTPTPGHEVFFSRYLDLDGREAMNEEASFDHLKVQRYIVHQKQLKEIYVLSVKNGKLLFSITKAGISEQKEQDLPENLVIGPSLVPFLRENWKEIQSQKTVKVQLAVLDRMDTYGFEFAKVQDSKANGMGTVIVRMRPLSVFVSTVVGPSYLTVSSDGSRILEIKGRMLPKKISDGHWVDFDGDAIFSY